MAETRRRQISCLGFINNVLYRGSQGRDGPSDMTPVTPLTLAAVFLAGVVCAALLRDWWTGLGAGQAVLSGSLGVLPAGADLALMDEGYVAMAMLGDHQGHRDHSDQDHQLQHKQTTELEDHNAQIEALNTLKAAKDLVFSGKGVRAGRLLEHALSLAPRHPEVLVHYGEFLEHHRHDVVRADKLYLRALAVSPANSRALRNRRRTQPLVDEMDVALLARVDGKRDELSHIPGTSAALRRIKKEAYYQHIYHTAGIEGNTMTLAQTRMILETRLAVGGKSIMEHNEILGLDSALKYINTTLLHRVGRVSLHDLLQIHTRVLGHSDPLQAGRLRTTQVFVSNHIPPPPTRLQVLMEDFVSWLNSAEAAALHPVRYAALAHYKLVFIHPFSDGNGRTARLVMNFLLMQAGFPPVIIRKQDRMLYYDGLQMANEGDTRPFVRFVAHCTEKTLDVYLWATKESLPKIEQQQEDQQNTQQNTPQNTPQQQKQNSQQEKSEAETLKSRTVYLHEESLHPQQKEETSKSRVYLHDGEGLHSQHKEKDAETSKSTVYLHEDDSFQSAEDRMFVFTPIDDISPWQPPPSEDKSSGERLFPPSTLTEDHILRDDVEEEEEEEVEVGEWRDHGWFVEERVRVRGRERRGGSSSSSSGGISSSSSSSSREHDEVIRYLISEERLAAFVEETETERGV